MPTAQPTRWPSSVTPAQALGYLLARHVPITRLPHGLTLIREAAGWIPRTGLDSPDLGMHPATVRSWLYAARQHAHMLGPPPGLTDLLAVLGDGVIRTASRARAALEATQADELSDPRILSDFAEWCGTETGFEVIPRARRRPVAVQAVAPQAADLIRARKIVDQQLRRYGLSSVNRVLAGLAEEKIRIDAGGDAQALRDLLGVDGYSAWFWPRRDVASPLTAAMKRLRALGTPLPLEQIPVAIARSSLKRWPREPGEWPPDVDAIRAWVNARPDWQLTGDDRIEPVGPLPPMHPHDRLIQSAIDRNYLSWNELHQALGRSGLTGSTAAAAIYKSPLLRRHHRKGYYLIGRRT